jgi:hypothetical protein
MVRTRKRAREEDSDDDDFIVPDDEYEEVESDDEESEQEVHNDEEDNDFIAPYEEKSSDEESAEEEASSYEQSDNDENQSEDDSFIAPDGSQERKYDEEDKSQQSQSPSPEILNYRRRGKRHKKMYTNTEEDLAQLASFKRRHDAFVRDVLNGEFPEVIESSYVEQITYSDNPYHDITILCDSNISLFTLLRKQMRQTFYHMVNDQVSYAEWCRDTIIAQLDNQIPRIPIEWPDDPPHTEFAKVNVTTKHYPDLRNESCCIKMHYKENFQTRLTIWDSIAHAMAHVAMFHFEGHYSSGNQCTDIKSGGHYDDPNGRYPRFILSKYVTEFMPKTMPIINAAKTEYERLFGRPPILVKPSNKQEREDMCSEEYRKTVQNWVDEVAWFSEACQVAVDDIPKIFESENRYPGYHFLSHDELFYTWADRISGLFPYRPRVSYACPCCLEDASVILYCTVCRDVMLCKVQYSDYVGAAHKDDDRGVHDALGVDGIWEVLMRYKDFVSGHLFSRQLHFTSEEVYYIIYDRLCQDSDQPVPRIVDNIERTYEYTD